MIVRSPEPEMLTFWRRVTDISGDSIQPRNRLTLAAQPCGGGALECRDPVRERVPGMQSRANADDRLAGMTLGRVEGGDGVFEGGDRADVGPQQAVADALDDFAQLSAVGFDDEVDRPSVGARLFDRSDDGHQNPARPNQARGPLADVAADQVEHEIDFADVFQRLVVEVDELVRAEVERRLAIAAAAG